MRLARHRIRKTAAEKEALLQGMMDFLLPQKYFVVADTGWSKWDLKIARGLWSRALVTVCGENHGESKRLLRVRCAMRSSSLARFLLRGYVALGAGSRKVIAMVVRETALVSMAGCLAGVLAAFALSRFLRSLLFGITPHDALTFAGCPAVLLAAALLVARLASAWGLSHSLGASQGRQAGAGLTILVTVATSLLVLYRAAIAL